MLATNNMYGVQIKSSKKAKKKGSSSLSQVSRSQLRQSPSVKSLAPKDTEALRRDVQAQLQMLQ